MSFFAKPTIAKLKNAKNKTIPDVISENLNILFCGINPGLYSGATGFHFARPGNRFWLTLFRAGFTPKLLNPGEQTELLKYNLGLTNLVSRTTATAAELKPKEIKLGVTNLYKKIQLYKPRMLAILGITAFRIGFQNSKAQLGLQPSYFSNTHIWVLPNPSGLNANYKQDDLTKLFKTLKTYNQT